MLGHHTVIGAPGAGDIVYRCREHIYIWKVELSENLINVTSLLQGQMFLRKADERFMEKVLVKNPVVVITGRCRGCCSKCRGCNGEFIVGCNRSCTQSYKRGCNKR